MVNEGYKDAGYEYLIIDDCWLEKERDNVTNKLVPDKKRFPNGMKAVADYVSKTNKIKCADNTPNLSTDPQQRLEVRSIRRLWN